MEKLSGLYGEITGCPKTEVLGDTLVGFFVTIQPHYRFSSMKPGI
jgi:hypothetical protein